MIQLQAIGPRPLVVTVDETTLIGSLPFGGFVQTPTVTATPDGGIIGSYAYQWEYVSGDPGISIETPTSAVTRFGAFLSDNTEVTAFFRCRVTSGSAVAFSPEVSVTLIAGSIS
jgi:hypothetical protein